MNEQPEQNKQTTPESEIEDMLWKLAVEKPEYRPIVSRIALYLRNGMARALVQVATIDGKSLQDMRKEKKVTQGQLARFLGVSTQAVSQWETGDRKISLKYIEPIKEFFSAK